MRTLGVLAVALVLPLAARASARPLPFPVAEASFSDSMHGWAPNYGVRLPCETETICATDDGGRTWRGVFTTDGDFAFLKEPVRTSATAGVVLRGRFGFSPFGTRDGGRTWFPMKRPPLPNPGLIDPTPPHFQGSGTLLFLHYFGSTLFRVVPWPRPSGADEFEYRAVFTVQDGKLGQMANVPGGVAAPVHGDDFEPRGSVVDAPAFIPHAVLVHRAGKTSVHPFPPAPTGDRPVGEVRGLGSSWPWLFFAGYRGVPGRCCERVRAVLWRSPDGGVSWRLEETARVRLRPRVSFLAPRTGAHIPLDGGWISAVRGRTAVAIRQAGRTRVLRLPSAGCAPRLARPRADWPYLYVESANRRLRWWSDDGGRSWAIFGQC